MSSWIERRMPNAGVIGLALAASVTSLWNGFAYDDKPVIAHDPRVHSLAHFWSLFGQSYWPAELHGGLYRPVITTLFALQWVTGAGAPIVFHVVSVSLYVGTVLLVWRVAGRLMSPAGAWLSAAVFAVHPVHVEAVGNVVGQAELCAAAGVLAILNLYVDARRRGALPVRTLALICLLYIAALLCKESAVVAPFLLLLVEACVGARISSEAAGDAPQRKRLFALYAAMSGCLAGVLALRLAVLGSSDKPLPNVVFWHLDAAGRALTMAGAAWQWARLLVWPSTLLPVYSPPFVPVLTHPSLEVLPGLLAALGLIAVAVVAFRREPVMSLAAGWIAIALVPVSNVLVPTGVLVAERTLFLPSVGLALLCGSLVAPITQFAAARRWSAMNPALTSIVALVLAAGTLRSAAHQRVWSNDARLVTAAVLTGEPSYEIDHLYGKWAESQNQPVMARDWLVEAAALYPEDPSVHADLGAVLMGMRHFQQAEAAFDAALSLDTANADARSGLVICLLHTNDTSAARREAQQGIAIGEEVPTFRELLALTDSVEQGTGHVY